MTRPGWGCPNNHPAGGRFWARSHACSDTIGSDKDGPGTLLAQHMSQGLTTRRGVAMDSLTPTTGRVWFARDLTPDFTEPFRERFLLRVDDGLPDECWGWLGHIAANGYGYLIYSPYKKPGRKMLAHRVAWVLNSGDALVDDMTIDHLCRVRSCVNPAHLEPVTLGENNRRARLAPNGGRFQTADERRAKAAAWQRKHYAEGHRRAI